MEREICRRKKQSNEEEIHIKKKMLTELKKENKKKKDLESYRPKNSYGKRKWFEERDSYLQ